jgi:hypothetical protein
MVQAIANHSFIHLFTHEWNSYYTSVTVINQSYQYENPAFKDWVGETDKYQAAIIMFQIDEL